MDFTVLTIIVLLIALLVMSVRNFIRWKNRFETKGVKDLNKMEDLEVRLYSIMNGIKEACLFVRTNDLSILEFNKRACQLSGYTREELAKITLSGLLTEAKTGDLAAALHKVLEGDTSSSVFFEMKRSDDVHIPVEVSVKPARWRHESALLVVVLDTLEKMRLGERVAKDQELLMAVADVVKVFNEPSDEIAQFLEMGRIMRHLIPHQRMSIHYLNESGDELLGHYVDYREEGKVFREKVSLTEGSPHRKAIVKRQPVVIADVSEEKGGIGALLAEEGFCSVLLMPLLMKENVIGLLGLFDMRPGAFSRKDVETISHLAGHIALGVYTSNLSREMERKTQRLKQILVTSNSFRLQVFLDDLLREIVWSVRFSTGFGSVALGMVEKDTDRVEIKALASENKEVVRNLTGTGLSWQSMSRLMDEKNRVGRSYLIISGEPILTPSRFSEGRFQFEGTREESGGSGRSSLFVPIESRLGKIVGFLLVEDPQDGARPSLETIQTLEIFANQVAVVIENQRLFAEAKQKSEELELLNEKLRASKDDIEAVARKLEESNWELEKVNEELREADKFKAEFLQNITHELRTPIAPIIINTDMLLSRRLGDLQPRQEEVVKSINESGKRINELIMDLLYLSRMEDGKLEFVMGPVDPRTLIGSSLREISPLAKEKGIKIREVVPPGVPLILGDERHLIQLLTNLLRNAVKFTSEGGNVVVAAKAPDGGRAVVELEVSDTGIGIPESKLERIFERFYQVDGSATRKYQGAGLGLAIVKKIVEAHRGEIEVESKPGEGATFRVRLPAHLNGVRLGSS
jgi:PAS domain S-box-containing protein